MILKDTPSNILILLKSGKVINLVDSHRETKVQIFQNPKTKEFEWISKDNISSWETDSPFISDEDFLKNFCFSYFEKRTHYYCTSIEVEEIPERIEYIHCKCKNFFQEKALRNLFIKAFNYASTNIPDIQEWRLEEIIGEARDSNL